MENPVNQNQPSEAPKAPPTKTVELKDKVASVIKPKLSVPQLKIPKKVVILLALTVVLLVVALLALSVAKNARKPEVAPSQLPSPTPSATPVVELPSQYADDEDVARIKENMSKLEQDLNGASFRDERLRVPTLDWDVKFE